MNPARRMNSEVIGPALGPDQSLPRKRNIIVCRSDDPKILVDVDRIEMRWYPTSSFAWSR